MRCNRRDSSTLIPQRGEYYREKYKLFCTHHENNPFGIHWMRYEADCPLPELAKNLPHAGFAMDDLQEAFIGKHILIEPNSPSEGVIVAFVICEGALAEYFQFLKPAKVETVERISMSANSPGCVLEQRGAKYKRRSESSFRRT